MKRKTGDEEEAKNGAKFLRAIAKKEYALLKESVFGMVPKMKLSKANHLMTKL